MPEDHELALTRAITTNLEGVRDEIADSPYIEEAARVLLVGGYRSAIGCIWNAVVDDLRNKIMYRSLNLFNKSVTLPRSIDTYEDFQNYVSDDLLIEGAYKTGVIGWEASRILKHCKETRHIFDGHPKSSNPSLVKVLAMIEDCFKYVLSLPYPPQLIDLDEYPTTLQSADFARSDIGVENAVSELPDIYKTELINRLFSAFVHIDSPSTLRSNIAFVAPILWQVLPKVVRIQIARRVDQEIQKAQTGSIDQAFEFVRIVDAGGYLSAVSRKFKIKPLVTELGQCLDQFDRENAVVRELEQYAALVPDELISQYINGLVATYVGHIGGSAHYARIDFYANGAAIRIPSMLEKIDDRGVAAFIKCLKTNTTLRSRLNAAAKMRRLRALGTIVRERASKTVPDIKILGLLLQEDKGKAFKAAINL